MASDLRPEGLSITLGGEERHFLFTLNVIDELQTHYDKTMFEIFQMLADEKLNMGVVKHIVSTLLTDEAERAKWKDKNSTLRTVSEKEAGWLITNENAFEVNEKIMVAYGFSMPKAEDDDPNEMSETMNS